MIVMPVPPAIVTDPPQARVRGSRAGTASRAAAPAKNVRGTIRGKGRPLRRDASLRLSLFRTEAHEARSQYSKIRAKRLQPRGQSLPMRLAAGRGLSQPTAIRHR